MAASIWPVEDSGQEGTVTTTPIVTVTLKGIDKGAQSVWVEAVGGGDLMVKLGDAVGLTVTNGARVSNGRRTKFPITPGTAVIQLLATAGTVTWHVFEDKRG